MLVLQRKAGESIRVGDDIEIHILAVEHDKVKVGLVAPRHVQIVRSELYGSIREENVRASRTAVPREELLKALRQSPEEPKDSKKEEQKD